MFLTDTHCHLNLAQFDHDREKVIRKAIDDSNIQRILIPGLDNGTSVKIIQLCQQYKENLFPALGIHPNSLIENVNQELNNLRKTLFSVKAVCVGEIGLDYYRKNNSPKNQIQLFRTQLELAAEINLPVCIHNRDAEIDLLIILIDWYANIKKNRPDLMNRPGVLHAFNGTGNFVEKTKEMNFYYGIGGAITFPSNLEYRERIRTLPRDRILIETDSPYLSPHPFRGKRNEPSNVLYVVRELANLFSMTESEVIQVTTNNAQVLFNWG